MRIRDVLRRGVAVLALLVCLGGAAWTAWTAWRAVATGVARGRYGGLYLRADGDFFYYSTVTLNVVASLLWLGLAVFAIVVLVRWEDWT